MEPIPETVWAIEELGPFVHDGDLLEELTDLGERASAVVPDIVGLSMESAEHGVTFTLLASHAQRAVFDALQRPSGSGSDAVAAPEPSTTDDLLDEDSWQERALLNAAPCVKSTLTMPLVDGGRVAGAISLYGASRRAFAGHHEELAEALGAWVEGAVTNADLPFASLREALRAPRKLRSASTIDRAAEIVSAEQQVSVPMARNRIREAADRAGISETQLAEAVIRLRNP
ncbi:GAF domain-containing protein [Nocardioides sp. KIGAM211]|uniref:GAF domain-containing protein n=1 Tax=Nocardioides luti TaxID=2761101 RepID=A0A7X0VAN1_9ACTN|nr:GAF domain-containing protein [Nocardioides luti]MBB6627776.1 GAF domain-containing protein [Nocardioides luti]